MHHRIKLTINSKPYEFDVEPGEKLLDILRYRLELTGTKKGCDSGGCGACTVIVDEWKTIYSCMALAASSDGKKITTIEGLANEDRLDPVQQAFIDYDAIQCGFCSPGFIMSARALLNRNPNPTLDEIKEAIVGNLCRCTGYVKIFAAIQAASQAVKK